MAHVSGLISADAGKLAPPEFLAGGGVQTDDRVGETEHFLDHPYLQLMPPAAVTVRQSQFGEFIVSAKLALEFQQSLRGNGVAPFAQVVDDIAKDSLKLSFIGNDLLSRVNEDQGSPLSDDDAARSALRGGWKRGAFPDQVVGLLQATRRAASGQGRDAVARRSAPLRPVGRVGACVTGGSTARAGAIHVTAAAFKIPRASENRNALVIAFSPIA